MVEDAGCGVEPRGEVIDAGLRELWFRWWKGDVAVNRGAVDLGIWLRGRGMVGFPGTGAVEDLREGDGHGRCRLARGKEGRRERESWEPGAVAAAGGP